MILGGEQLFASLVLLGLIPTNPRDQDVGKKKKNVRRRLSKIFLVLPFPNDRTLGPPTSHPCPYTNCIGLCVWRKWTDVNVSVSYM